MTDEFDLLKTLENLLKNWWVIVVIAALGGFLGLGFSYLKPAKYEAEAIFHASIDYSDIDFENLLNESGEEFTLSQYDQDLALQVVQRMLLATRNQAHRFARTLDPMIGTDIFLRDSQIRRYHAQWILKYRHEDPEIAQAIVNYWTDRAWEALQKAQAQGRAEKFIIMDQVSKAELPQVPIYQNRNNLILAGTVIGLSVGVVFVDFKHRSLGKHARKA